MENDKVYVLVLEGNKFVRKLASEVMPNDIVSQLKAWKSWDRIVLEDDKTNNQNPCQQ